MGIGYDTLRRSSTGTAIGVIGISSIARQASEFLRSGLDSTPVFFSDSEVELIEAKEMYVKQLTKDGISGVMIQQLDGQLRMRRAGR